MLVQAGMTPLMLAVDKGKHGVAKFFLNQNADVNAKNDVTPVRCIRLYIM